MYFRMVELAVAKDRVAAFPSFKREQGRYTLGKSSTVGKYYIVPDRPSMKPAWPWSVHFETVIFGDLLGFRLLLGNKYPMKKANFRKVNVPALGAALMMA
jgi:hypothetical protein